MAIANTTTGPVEGLERNEPSDHWGPHHAFLGIPFAASTGGPNRFRPPQPVTPWTEPRPATAFEKSAPQGDHMIQGFASSTPRDEDCLYLNVYTPALDGARPVLFWIHGGGYTHGAGSELLYDGGPLATRGDVVVVTIHYRLGALGYADFEGVLDGAAANCGLLDQVAALAWVRDNIANFGGDPGNVTIFGESAGAAAVGALLATVPARGLFHKAILQSGSGRASSKEEAAKVRDALLRELGLDESRAAEVLALPWQQIVEAQGRVGMRWGPVCNEVIPVSPQEAIRNASAANVPILIGTNRDEVKLFNATSRDRAISDEDLPSMIAGALPKAQAADVSRLIEVYRASREAKGLPTSNVDVFDAITTDARFRINALNLAENYRKFPQDAYVYLFSWESPARRGAFGSCHALEMPFVFGTLWAPTQDRFAGSGPEAEALSHRMMDSWIAFAHTGNPSHEGVGEWPAYDAERRATMLFDRECGVADDPFAEEREAIHPFV